MKRLLCVALVLLAGHLGAQEVQPPVLPDVQRNQTAKYALVIGNSQYQGFNRSLKNPANDARLMAKTLTRLGFEVQTSLDVTREQMAEQVARFARELPAGATSVLFYAGHGIQIGGASYLMPVDIQLSSEQGVQQRAYPLRRMLDELGAARSAVNIVVLDACRDNPFQPPPPVRYRSTGPMGLAKVQAPRGTLLAYSTQPGQLAADGRDPNSVYTTALASTLLEPGLTLEDVFKKVNTLVRNTTRDDQIPWYESSITQNYYFLPPPDTRVVAGASPRQSGGIPGKKRSDRLTTRQQPQLWYMGMTDAQWSEMDWQIQQRVRHMTEDEIPEMTQLAQAGNVIAMTTLGLLYEQGVDKTLNSKTGAVSRTGGNNTLARHWFQMGADEGFPIAQTLLAESWHGAGRTKDALSLLQKAAKANYPRAKLNLFQLSAHQKTAEPALLLDAFKSMVRSTQPSR